MNARARIDLESLKRSSLKRVGNPELATVVIACLPTKSSESQRAALLSFRPMDARCCPTEPRY